MAVNPDKNIVEQSLIARLIGKIKRIALDMGDSVTAETARAQAAEAAAKTEVVQGENCTIEKTTAADGHDVYTVNAAGKPQVQADWNQADSSAVDYIKNKPNLALKENVANKSQSIDPTSTTEYGSSKAVADFVNSSVATNTANFLGSFSLADLSLTYPATDVQIAAALNSHTWPSGVTPTNNDYVYVEIQDPQTTGVDDKVERFKYSGLLESWGYEYTLNNSSFTAAEMATLESGITASDKTAWNSHVSSTSNPHNVTAAQIGAEPAFSVLPVNKGGTGADTIKGALSTLMSETQHYDTLPTDDTLIVHKFDTATASNGALYTRKLSYLWTYIQNKISSVLGLTATEYGGSASRSMTIYEDGSAGMERQVHIFGTENTDGLTGWRKIATITKLTNSYSSARICGKIFASGGNWGEGNNYENDFQIIVNFTNSKYYIYHKPSKNIQLLLRLVEVSPDSVYEVQVNPQGASAYSNFWVYAWADKGPVTWSIAWNDDLSVTGSQGTVLTNYDLDVKKFRLANGQVGSTTIPVYVDSNGQVKVCDPSQMSVGSASTASTASAATSGSALESAINAKQDTISDLATIRSGASAGATALQPSGNGSNLSVTPDGTSTGYDIGSSTTLKAFAQKFKNLVSVLKALAFKDKASYNDLSSGVQSSLDKADSALQSHQSVTDNNPTLSWEATSTIGKVGSTDLRVTMPANPVSYKVPFINIDSSLASLDLNTLTTQGFYYCPGFLSDSVVLSNIPSELNNFTKSWRLEVINQRSRIEQILVNASDNGQDATRVMGIWKRHRFSDGTNWTPWVNMRDADWINSGTFDAARIPTIWPDKMPFGRADYAASTTGYKNIALIKPPSDNNGDRLVSLDVYEFNANGTISYRGFINIGCRRDGSTYSYKAQYFGYQLANCSIVVRYSGNTHNALVYVGKTNSAYCSVVVVPKRGGNYDGTFDYSGINLYNDPRTEDISSYYNVTITNTYIPSSAGVLAVANGAVGSPSTPVYVDSNGQVQPCDPSLMSVGNATKWDGHAISIGTVSSSAGTISIV